MIDWENPFLPWFSTITLCFLYTVLVSFDYFSRKLNIRKIGDRKKRFIFYWVASHIGVRSKEGAVILPVWTGKHRTITKIQCTLVPRELRLALDSYRRLFFSGQNSQKKTKSAEFAFDRQIMEGEPSKIPSPFGVSRCYETASSGDHLFSLWKNVLMHFFHSRDAGVLCISL